MDDDASQDEPQDDNEAALPDSQDRDLADAYARLGLEPTSSLADSLKRIGPRFEMPKADLGRQIVDKHMSGIREAVKGAGLSEAIARSAKSHNPLQHLPSEHEFPDFEGLTSAVLSPIDDSPKRTAEATESMVQLLQDVHTVTADLVRLTNANVQMTASQHERARRTERFTRAMTWSSLGVAVASLGVAIVAIYT